MDRKEALAMVREKVSNPNLVKHMLACEACMRYLARRFEEDEETWGLAGLLHDLDYDLTKDAFDKHGLLAAEMLSGLVPEEVLWAIRAHADKAPRNTLMAKALYAIDPLTGLIVASALMHPKKSLEALDVTFVMNRLKEKGFARGANREQIKTCEEMGLTLEEFVGLCLDAMKSVREDLGL